LLIDRLRSLPNLSGFKRTNLGLLVRSSPKRVKTALIEAGEREPRLTGLLLIHQYLQEGVQANEFSTQNPEAMHYDKLLARSRQQCERVNLPIASRDTITELLNYMGNTLRHYLQPPQVSFDRSLGDSTATVGDFIPDPGLSPVERMVMAEQQQQTRQFRQQLAATLGQLPIDRAGLLLWLYGLKLTQAEAGIELNLNQSTIKHRRDRTLQQLAQDLHHIAKSTEKLEIETLATIVQALILVCEDQYPASLAQVLTLVRATIAETKLLPADFLTEQLCQLFIAEIQKQWQFKFKQQQMGYIKAATFVKNQLKSSS
jgi:hypothetical protein